MEAKYGHIHLFQSCDADFGASRELVVVRIQYRVNLIVVNVETCLFRRPQGQGSQQQGKCNKGY
jgi:hypothetical protein